MHCFKKPDPHESEKWRDPTQSEKGDASATSDKPDPDPHQGAEPEMQRLTLELAGSQCSP
jgi:hypothetical protein